MVVLIVESVPPSLRGELSKWMLEPKAGVFVGSVSAAVRDLIWEKACAHTGEGGCILIHSAANEQGFAMRSWGDTTRVVEQWEGLYLVRRVPQVSKNIAEEAPTVMRLWAKSDPVHPLPCHLVDVGFVAQELLRTQPFALVKERLAEAAGCPRDYFESWIGYLVALHDWGKGWRNFQARGPEHILASLRAIGLNVDVEDSEDVRHEAISRLWLEEHLIECGGWPRKSARTVGAAVGAHHGRLGQKLPRLLSFPGQDKWDALRREVEMLIRSTFAPGAWTAEFGNHSVVGMLLSGLIVWADWIASNEELFPLRWTGEQWDEYVEVSKLAAQAAVDKLGLTRRNAWQGINSFSDAWPGFEKLRPVQGTVAQLSGLEPDALGLTIIEAPMGEGKSEAALYLATQLMARGGGMYMALPTSATSNQMFERVKQFLEQHDKDAAAGVQLVHGTSWLLDAATPVASPEIVDEGESRASDLARDWFRPKKRSLLATYGVGTVDQALMSVLHVKHGFLRLFGLAGKVLIIDEVHAYDAYMSEILTLLLAWCRALSIHVILLSATLPEFKRRALIEAYTGEKSSDGTHDPALAPYPLITTVSATGQIKEYPVPAGERRFGIVVEQHEGLLGDATGIARLALEKVGEAGCLCIIANTVGSAQAIYEELKRQAPDIPTLLFHGRFRAAERDKVEQQALTWFGKRSLLPKSDPAWAERPKRAILVATQVVEQSLDLDFDEMITELAPIDLLLQRSGRLHRHQRPERPRTAPVLHVALPPTGSFDFGSTGHVYAPYILMRTQLSLGREWSLPEEMRSLIEAVYGPEPMNLAEDVQNVLDAVRARWEREQQQLAKDAAVYLIPEPYAKAFKLDRVARALYEDDEGLQRYFTAKTRHGNYTLQVALLEREKWFDTVVRDTSPPRAVLQDIMLQTVNLPRWWLQDVEAEEGFENPMRAPRWLPVEQVLFMENGVWRGRTAKDERIRIEVDSELGVRLVGREDETVDAL